MLTLIKSFIFDSLKKVKKIILAERKPPLFNMNVMSALYQIAQNDPPSLSTDNLETNSTPWSYRFTSFIDQCLRKDPLQRLSTNECLNVCF